jgi:hypothetical protein
MTGLVYGLKSLKRKLGKAFRILHNIGCKNVTILEIGIGVALPLQGCQQVCQRTNEPTANVNEC